MLLVQASGVGCSSLCWGCRTESPQQGQVRNLSAKESLCERLRAQVLLSEETGIYPLMASYCESENYHLVLSCIKCTDVPFSR